LGGAEAVLAAVDQAVLGYNVHFYSYGQPRVGDANFAKFFN
jgi:predicted lipase